MSENLQLWPARLSHTIGRVVTTRLLALALAASVVSLTVAPPAHVHEAEEEGHHELLVHRHLSAHPLAPRDHGHGGIDHADERILTLDSAFTIPSAPTLSAPLPPATIAILEPPVAVSAAGLPDYFEPLIHGPPRAPAGLRAPPVTSRL